MKIIINIISRNHKTLRSCVAPSVSPGSIYMQYFFVPIIVVIVLVLIFMLIWSFFLQSPPKLPTKLRWLLSEPSLNEAHSGSNFQSFPRGQSPPLEKNYYSFSLYCLIQTASLFKNILIFKVKVEKIIKILKRFEKVDLYQRKTPANSGTWLDNNSLKQKHVLNS